jgi:hypothetical protein
VDASRFMAVAARRYCLLIIALLATMFPVTAGAVPGNPIIKFEVVGPPDVEILDGQVTPVDFGITTVGNPVTLTFRLTNNNGGSPLQTSNLVVPAGYTDSGLPGAVPAPIGVRTFTITLTAASQGIFNGTVSFDTNDPNYPAFDFPVTGFVICAPSVTCPVDVVVDAPAGECSAQVIVPAPNLSDNCSTVTLTNDRTGTADASDVYPVGTTSVTFTVVDEYQNEASCTMNVTVRDVTPPSIACPENIILDAASDSCGAEVIVPVPSVDDDCSSVTLVNDFNGTSDASGVYPVGTTNVSFLATDDWGTTATCSLTVTVNDVTAPSITCPGNIEVNAPADGCGAIVEILIPEVTDNCSTYTLTNSYTGTSDASGIYPVGVTTVTYTAIDAASNENTCQFTVTVKDVTPPSILCPSDITADASVENCTADIEVSLPEVSDNCGGVTITNDFTGESNASDTYPLGTTIVTYTATDGAGNSASCQLTVTVQDVNAPSITCPENITVDADVDGCSASVEVPSPEVADSCSTYTLTNDYNDTADASAVYPVGVTTVNFTAEDSAGNSNSCSFTITVIDATPPSVSCPENISVDASGDACSALVEIAIPEFADNCTTVTLTNDITGSEDASATYPVGTTTVTYTATDSAGNQASCSFDVTVNDVTAPTISCPANITVNAGANACSAAVTVPAPTVNDSCAGVTVTNSFNGTANASGTYPVGVTTVTFTATDAAGNDNTCQMTVTVNDVTAPTISCPANITVNAPANACSAAVTVPAPTVNDSCAGVTVTNSFNGTANASGTYPVGVTTVTFTATDAAGNDNTCQMTVTVNDVTAPTISCPANIVVNGSTANCTAEVTVPAPTVNDSCAGVTVTNSFNGTANASGTYPAGVTTVTFTATDAAGNENTCQMTVTVNCAATCSTDNDPVFAETGTSQTLTWTITSNDAPVEGIEVHFMVISGPNSGYMEDVTTNAQGQATITLLSDLEGVDVVEGTGTYGSGDFGCAASIIWSAPDVVDVPLSEPAGWTYVSPAPPFIRPFPFTDVNLLGIRTKDNTNSFGYWLSPYFTIGSKDLPVETAERSIPVTEADIAGTDLYRIDFHLKSNLADLATMPTIRVRQNTFSLEQSDVVVITSTGDGALSPPTSGRTYPLFVLMPDTQNQFSLSFDVLNFDPNDVFHVDLSLDQVTMTAVGTDNLTGEQAHLSQNFLGNQSNGWTPRNAAPTFAVPNSAVTTDGLQIGGGGAEAIQFGFWGSPEGTNLVNLQANRLYAVTFEMGSDADAGSKSQVSTFRGRINTASSQLSAYILSESSSDAARTPISGQPLSYTCYFAAPPEQAGQELLFSLDWLYVPNTGNSNAIPIYLRTLNVTSYDLP